MIVIGIDPGATGALAFLDTQTGQLNVQDMPATLVKQGMRRVHRVSAALLAALIDVHGGGPMLAYVEQVASMPNQGVASVFAFGKAAGIVEGVLAALHIPTVVIPPQTWMRGVGLAGAVKDRKEASRGKACQLYPASAQTFARVKDHGRAEAALIAHFGASLLRKESAANAVDYALSLPPRGPFYGRKDPVPVKPDPEMERLVTREWNKRTKGGKGA